MVTFTNIYIRQWWGVELPQLNTLSSFSTWYLRWVWIFLLKDTIKHIFVGRRSVIGISGSLIWSKTLMKLIFNRSGEFRWSLEGPGSQIHSPHRHAGAPGIFSDLLRSVQTLKRDWVRKATGSYRTYLSLVKLQPGFLSLWWKICFWAELRPWFLSLQWRTCSWVEYSYDDDINGKCYLK